MNHLEITSRVEGHGARCEDRVEVFRRADFVVVIVADGAGGTSGGAAAAAIVVEAVRQRSIESGNLLDPATWRRVLGAVGERLENDNIGQSTAVVVATDGTVVSGASVGDSEAWLVGATDLRDLSVGQPRKPLLGGGSVEPRAFKEQLRPGETLLVATDGITKYATTERICSVVRRADLSADDRAAAIVQLVRLPNGSLQDDVGLATVRWLPALRQYQLVRVRTLRAAVDEYDGWRVNKRHPRVGDVGTLVDLLHAPGLPDRYVVECPSASGDGTTDWLGDFAEDELESVD